MSFLQVLELTIVINFVVEYVFISLI